MKKYYFGWTKEKVKNEEKVFEESFEKLEEEGYFKELEKIIKDKETKNGYERRHDK